MKAKRKKILTVVALLLCIALFVTLGAKAIGVIVEIRANKKENSSTTDATAFEGLKISFLGDSITSYNGYSNNEAMNSTIGNNGCYYNASKMPVNETYWKRVIDTLGMTLCVNNSWDGGRVTDTKPGITSGVERAKQLHNDVQNVKPDIIIVYMGTNDVANDDVKFEDFKPAYEEMLDNIKANYPKATVYCCTILPESRTVDKPSEVTNYNDAIRSMVKDAGYGIIDFAKNIPDWDYTAHTFVDGALRVHPTSGGMEKLSKCIIETFMRNRFIFCNSRV